MRDAIAEAEDKKGEGGGRLLEILETLKVLYPPTLFLPGH